MTVSPDRTVVVLTRPDDVTADLVVLELGRRGVPVFRFDIAEFPAALVLDGELVGGRWTGGLRTPHRHVDLDKVGAVYYRRPTEFRFPAEMTEADREWARAEAVLGFGGVFTSLPATWVNHPHTMALAEFKPIQLVRAHELGLATPRTLITNDPSRAGEFAESVPGGVVYKSFRGSPRHVVPPLALFTTPVTVDQCEDASVEGTAHLFQQRVEKRYEVRLTVVGQAVFAARIDAGSEAAGRDWRADPDALTYSVIQPPDQIRDAAVALTQSFGLAFGALDFIVSPDDQWVFLELNAAGQWAWIPEIRDPITAALAEILTQERT